jgi:intracellular sulfur oxidation DsrE/DsrF family protein
MKMKCLLLFTGLLFFFLAGSAQAAVHKIVYDITTADTAVQRGMLLQINNIMKDAPGSEVEVVCHGGAIFMLVKDKTVVLPAMEALQKQHGVSFSACNNSMRKNNIDSSALAGVSHIVPNGALEVVSKQEQHWSYIKAGQ